MFNFKKIRSFFTNSFTRFSFLQSIGSFLKFKLLKFGIKIAILLGILWYFSGSWLGKKLEPVVNTLTGGTYYYSEKLLDFIELTAQVLLVLVLLLIVLGKSIWRGFYVLIGIGVLITILRRFVF